MAFQGSLQELPLPDILQLVAVSGKTGSFTIQNDRESGRIFLSDGQIVHAQMGRLEGEEAVYELAIWPEGEFLFSPGEVSVPTTITKSNTSLLMEAARRIDEWQVLAKKVPSTSMVPNFAESDGSSQISLTPKEWAVVRKLDGRRSVEEIAFALGSSPFETAKVIYGLITNGLVTLSAENRQLDLDTVEAMGDEELLGLAARIRQEARAYLTGHARATELENELGRMIGEFRPERGSEAIVEIVRAAETAVSTARGPNQAKSFLDSVNTLMGS